MTFLIETQWCRRCQQDKPFNHFYESHKTRCIRCISEFKKLAYLDLQKRAEQQQRCKNNYYKTQQKIACHD